jgi:Tol biopolymer transport system component
VIVERPFLGDVWIHDLRRDAARRVTLGGQSFLPLWSPNGRQLTFTARRNDLWYLLQSDADGSGDPKQLLEASERLLSGESWSPDGETLLYSTLREDTGFDLLLHSVKEGTSRTFVASPDYDSEGSFSPDGKWVVYTSEESGVAEIYVQALAEPGRRWQVSDSMGRDPIWTSGGQEIVYRSGRRILSVAVRTEPGFEASSPQVLFEGPFVLETGGFRNFDVTKDGRRFVMVQSDQGPLDRLDFVLNWDDELRRLVPR